MNKHIIIIHEIYGVTHSLLDLKKYLDDFGFTVSLPSLYKDNYCGSDSEESYEKFYKEVGLEKAYDIINDLIDDLIESDPEIKIILLGFSVGATVAWMHSGNRRISEVICVYGSKIREYLYINPAVKAYLFFCRENNFNIHDIQKVLDQKKMLIHGLFQESTAFITTLLLIKKR